MAMSGTVELTNEVRGVYDAEYYFACQNKVYFDQFCNLRMQMNGQRGKTYSFPIVESSQPSDTALDEYTDVVSQALSANEITVTLQEFGGAFDVTKFLVATSYVDVFEQHAIANGYNLAESVDRIVRRVAGQGSRVFYPISGLTRATINGADNATHRLTENLLERISILARAGHMPLYEDETLCAMLHPFPFYDLLQSDDVRTMSTRREQDILFNGELGYWSGIRMIVSTSCKVFWGQGAVRTSTPFASTLAAAAPAGSTNLKVVANTNLAGDEWMSIRDAAETGNTWSDTNEIFRVTNVGTTGAGGGGIDGYVLNMGSGDEGGTRFAHGSGTVVNDAAAVYPIVLLGPHSITKVASDLTGPYGETIVSEGNDKLNRFWTFGWYLIAGYARTRNAWLYRLEVGAAEI